MRLSLEDKRLAARLSGLSDGRDKLILIYPEDYRTRILCALAEFLRPPTPRKANDKEGQHHA